MENCFKCGISDSKALLYDAITPEGIQKICRKCSCHDNAPLIKNKDAAELKNFESKQDTYERISKVAGTDNKRKLNQRSFVLEQQETNLRDLVEKNVCKGLNRQAKSRDDLVKNFHWLIKRYRRLKHLNTKQFAEAIKEPEKLVILAEQGVLPEGYDFIRKVEKLLGIALIKQDVYDELKQKEQKQINFKEETDMTIADLKEKTKKKGGIFGFFFGKKEKVAELEETLEDEETSDEEEQDLVKENNSQKK